MRSDKDFSSVPPPPEPPRIGAPPLKTNFRIKQLRDQMLNALDAVNDSYDCLLARDPAGRPRAPVNDYDKWKKANDVYIKLLETLWIAVGDEKREAAGRAAVDNIKRKEDLVAELLLEYGDFGPQYRHLIDLLAGLSVRMEAHLAVGGSDDDYLKMANLKLDVIGQLQKYTEKTRTETTQISATLNEFGTKFMAVVESVLLDQPSKVIEITDRFTKLLVEENPQ